MTPVHKLILSNVRSKKRHYEVDEDSPTNMDKKEAKKLRKQAEKVMMYSDSNCKDFTFSAWNRLRKHLGIQMIQIPLAIRTCSNHLSGGKKKEKEKKEGKERKNDDESRLRLMKDIDRVRKRRIERENELEEMERLRAEEQRLREVWPHSSFFNIN